MAASQLGDIVFPWSAKDEPSQTSRLTEYCVYTRIEDLELCILRMLVYPS